MGEKCDFTLLQALERLPELNECTLADILKRLLKGVAAIHALDLVHRDIKPDNFLVQGSTVKLCDFGMAEIMPGNSELLKGVYGTAPFMSPEMLKGAGYDPKTDVWSIGVIAYVLYLGKFPYQPTESVAKAMKAAIRMGTPRPNFEPSSGLPEVSTRAKDFLKEIFDRAPTTRVSADQLLTLLKKIIESKELNTSPSLRPMVYCAKRIGAFDTRRVKEEDGDMDTILKQIQLKQHGQTQMRTVSRVSSGSRTGSKVSGHRHAQQPAEAKQASLVSSSSTQVGSDSFSDHSVGHAHAPRMFSSRVQ